MKISEERVKVLWVKRDKKDEKDERDKVERNEVERDEWRLKDKSDKERGVW
jgi:hypothetical protein